MTNSAIEKAAREFLGHLAAAASPGQIAIVILRPPGADFPARKPRPAPAHDFTMPNETGQQIADFAASLEGPRKVMAQALYEEFRAWLKARGAGDDDFPPSLTEFGKKIRLAPNIRKRKIRKGFQYIVAGKKA